MRVLALETAGEGCSCALWDDGALLTRDEHAPPIDVPGVVLSIPVKHTTGCFFAPPEQLEAIEASGQVAFRYAPGENPNGSVNDIAGVRNEAGNVVGLMPHPEHAVDELTGSVDGLRLFESAALALA